VRLASAGAGEQAPWLYVGPGGLELALLDQTTPTPDARLEVGGRVLRPVASGTATVDVRSQAGAASGVLVVYSRLAAEDAVGLTEQWPDGARHAYVGRKVNASDFEVWPATDPSSARG
jgi:hypothetical protein